MHIRFTRYMILYVVGSGGAKIFGSEKQRAAIKHGECNDLGYVHTAPFSFLSVFVDENAARSHCSVFK